MTLDQLEAEFLALPREVRASLLARWLNHSEQLNDIDPAITQVWMDEAEQRDRAMEKSGDSGTPAQEVFQRIRASLQ